MAVSEDEEFEFRKRAEAEAASTQQSPSLLGAIGKGAANLIPHAVQAWHAATVDLPDAAIALATKPDARARLAAALRQGVSDIGDTVGGYTQQVRDLSPAAFQGSAPRMDTAPAQAMESGVVQKYGVNVSPKRLSQALAGDLGQPNANAYNTAKTALAEHPLAALLAAAPGVGRAAGAVGDLAEATGVTQALAPAGQKISDALGNVAPGVSRVLDAGSTDASQAVRSAALAKVLAQSKAADDAASQAASLKAADVPLRSAMEDAAAAQAAKGVGVSDIPQAKALVADLKSKLSPTGSVVTIPTTDQAKAYNTIIEALSPGPNGQKPSLEMVQNMRRQIAQPAYAGADPSGFAAIGKLDRRNLVQQLHDIEDAYTGGAAAPVRENWRAATVASDQADELGKMKTMLTAQAVQLDELPATQAASKAQGIVASLAKKGLVSDTDYRDFMQLANAATTAQGKAAFRKKLALYTGAGLVGAEATHLGSNLAGAVR